MASDATFNSLISLATWIIWKWRNDAVFNYSSASVQCLLQAVDVEIHLCHLWCTASAKGLTSREASTG
jgi:hypothetical protein